MINYDIRAHEVEYDFDTQQQCNPLPKLEAAQPARLSTEEFIQKRKAIIDKLIDMSVESEQP